ncbi:hypothetical protein Ciccas_009963 [Cichlidogyrus casuarinus]|uniref:Uncharacterized protein n=1 Tax=Cichlidogyrus casuarinus TaxID=1844966 RepID=A0ABD2PYC1_9PLAT
MAEISCESTRSEYSYNASRRGTQFSLSRLPSYCMEEEKRSKPKVANTYHLEPQVGYRINTRQAKELVKKLLERELGAEYETKECYAIAPPLLQKDQQLSAYHDADRTVGICQKVHQELKRNLLGLCDALPARYRMIVQVHLISSCRSNPIKEMTNFTLCSSVLSRQDTDVWIEVQHKLKSQIYCVLVHFLYFD